MAWYGLVWILEQEQKQRCKGEWGLRASVLANGLPGRQAAKSRGRRSVSMKGTALWSGYTEILTLVTTTMVGLSPPPRAVVRYLNLLLMLV